MGVIFQKFIKDYDAGLLEAIENYMGDEGIEDISDINIADMVNYVRDNFIPYQEIIYFDEAWSYIGNGRRLEDSIDLAVEYGYDIKDVNCELLATLLRQQDLEVQLSNIADEL